MKIKVTTFMSTSYVETLMTFATFYALYADDIRVLGADMVKIKLKNINPLTKFFLIIRNMI